MENNTVNKELEEGRFYGIVSYIAFFCILGLILKKENKFVIFHAKQGLVIFVIEVACALIAIVPYIGYIVNVAGYLLCFVLSILGIISVLQGNCNRLPLVADIADKIVL